MAAHGNREMISSLPLHNIMSLSSVPVLLSVRKNQYCNKFCRKKCKLWCFLIWKTNFPPLLRNYCQNRRNIVHSFAFVLWIDFRTITVLSIVFWNNWQKTCFRAIKARVISLYNDFCQITMKNNIFVNRKLWLLRCFYF